MIAAKRDERGIILVLQEAVLFDSGKADLKDQAHPLLHKIAVLLKSVSNPIRVEGHTDSRPISTYRFPSNWELSAARASTVIGYFTSKEKLDSSRFSCHRLCRYKTGQGQPHREPYEGKQARRNCHRKKINEKKARSCIKARPFLYAGIFRIKWRAWQSESDKELWQRFGRFSVISDFLGIGGYKSAGSDQLAGSRTDACFPHFFSHFSGILSSGFIPFISSQILAHALGTTRQMSYPPPPTAIHLPLQ